MQQTFKTIDKMHFYKQIELVYQNFKNILFGLKNNNHITAIITRCGIFGCVDFKTKIFIIMQCKEIDCNGLIDARIQY